MSDAFDKLKKARKGQSALDLLSDDEELFVEMDEEEHDELRRDRLRNDFVVDDPEGLYAERDGGDNWQDNDDSRGSYLDDESYDEQDDLEMEGTRKRKAKAQLKGKKKKGAFDSTATDTKVPELDAGQQTISSAFSNATVKKKIGMNPLDALLNSNEPIVTELPKPRLDSEIRQMNKPMKPSSMPSVTKPRGRGRGAATRQMIAPRLTRTENERTTTPVKPSIVSVSHRKTSDIENPTDEPIEIDQLHTINEEHVAAENHVADESMEAPSETAEASLDAKKKLLLEKKKFDRSKKESEERKNICVDDASSNHNVSDIPTYNLNCETTAIVDHDLPVINDSLQFYWIDHHEGSNGGITIFGKCRLANTNGASSHHYRSISINIPDIWVPIYLRPRDDSKSEDDIFDEVTREVANLLEDKHIQFLACPVSRMSIFNNPNKLGEPMPREGPRLFIKLLIRSRFLRQLPQQLQIGGHSQTWTHAVGLGLSPMEYFMTKRRILGPRWLNLSLKDEDGNSSFEILPPKSHSNCHFNLRMTSCDTVKSLRSLNDRLPRRELSEEQINELEIHQNKLRARFSYLSNPDDYEGSGSMKSHSDYQRPKYQDGTAPVAPPLRVTSMRIFTLTHDGSNKKEIIGFSLMTCDITDSIETELSKRTNWNEDIVPFQNNGAINHSSAMIIGIRKCKTSFQWHPAHDAWEKETRKEGYRGPNLWLFNGEKQLLACLSRSIQTIDPDVIVGHTLIGGDLDIIHGRLNHHKLPHSLGRLKKLPMASDIHYSSYQHRISKALITGRLAIDVAQAAREFLPSQVNYTIESLSEYLHLPKWLYCGNDSLYSRPIQLTMGPIMKLCNEKLTYDHAYKRLERVFNLDTTVDVSSHHLPEWITIMDKMLLESRGIIHILAKISAMSLTRELSTISGFPWQGSCFFSRAERNAMMLNHQFHSYKALLPDGYHLTNKGPRQDGSYEGGLVLDPRPGLYETFVMLLDFNSLYPSIIQEYNICWTTVDTSNDELNGEDALNNPINGILPEILGGLVNRRAEVKKNLAGVSRELNKQIEAKNNDYVERLTSQKKTLETLSMAIKLCANSIYGCLGFSQSRYYARSMAAMITSCGRQILSRTKDLVEDHLRLNVIYGDTDSIMVDTGLNDKGEMNIEVYREVEQLGAKIVQAVNKNYKKLEIELEDVYKRLLLHKKKKYAFVKVLNYQNGDYGDLTMKGLDIVRRDWSVISKKCGRAVLDFLFQSATVDSAVSRIYEFLSNVNDGLNHEISAKFYANEAASDPYRFTYKDFIITKALTKAPAAYGNASTQPHVLVANQLISIGRNIPAGTEIDYIICTETLEDATSRFDLGQDAPRTSDTPIETDDKENTGFVGDRQSKPKSNPLSRACDPTLVCQYKMVPDLEWYRKQQIFPPMYRLLSCLPQGLFDSYTLQQKLGVSNISRVGNSAPDGQVDEEYAQSVPIIQLSKNKKTMINVNYSIRAKELADQFIRIECHYCQKSDKLSSVLSNKVPHCQSCLSAHTYKTLENKLGILHNELTRLFYGMTTICCECNTESYPHRMGHMKCPSTACLSNTTDRSITSVYDSKLIYDIIVYLETCCEQANKNVKINDNEDKNHLMILLNEFLLPFDINIPKKILMKLKEMKKTIYIASISLKQLALDYGMTSDVIDEEDKNPELSCLLN